MDACKMDFKDKSFDLVLDKATLDSIRCAVNFQLQVEQYLKEVRRVLTRGGVFVCVSHGIPFVMLKHLDQPHLGWSVEVRHVNKLKPPQSSESKSNCQNSWMSIRSLWILS